jgi:hypothetical protein
MENGNLMSKQKGVSKKVRNPMGTSMTAEEGKCLYFFSSRPISLSKNYEK